MKRQFLFLLAAALFFTAQPANAQLGNIFKKVKQTVDALTGTDNQTTTQKQSGETTTAQSVLSVAIPSGGTMENPFSSMVDIELQGAYGVSTSLNYGTVYLVLKVKMIANMSSIVLGGKDSGQKSMAVDQDGNVYEMGNMSSSGAKRCDVTEGIFVKVKLDSPASHFQDVKKTATEFQVIKLDTYIDPSHRGPITFKNVPILWDQEPQ